MNAYGPEAHFDTHGTTEHFAPGDRADNANDQGATRILPGTDYADMSTVSRKQWLVHHLLAVGELSALYGEPARASPFWRKTSGCIWPRACRGSAAR